MKLISAIHIALTLLSPLLLHESASAQNSTGRDNHSCYSNQGIAMMFHPDAEKRRDLSAKANTALSQTQEGQGITAMTSGDDARYLLYVAAPQNEVAMQQWARISQRNDSMRANFCVLGFDEVQFIIRDSNMNQRLVARIKTDTSDVDKYWRQHSARPMQ